MGISPKLNTVVVKTKEGTLVFPYKADISFLSAGFITAGGDLLAEKLRYHVVKLLGDIVKHNSPMVVSHDPDLGDVTVKLEYTK